MSFRKGITLQLGTLTTMVNIESAIEKEGTGLKTVCVGDDQNPHPPTGVRQNLACPTCQNNDRSSFKKAKVDGKEFTVVEADEVATVKDASIGFSKDIIQLSAHQSAEIGTRTIQGGSVYYLTPSKPALALLYGLLVDTMGRHPEVTFLGQWTPTSRASLYQFKVFGDTLVMEERARPESLKVVQQPLVPIGKEHQAQMDQLLPQIITPFDPDTYADAYAAKLAELVESKQAIEGVLPTKSKGSSATPVAGTVDLTALLNDALSSVGVKGVA